MTTERYLTLLSFCEELRGERVLVRPYQESDAQSLFEAIAESREHRGRPPRGERIEIGSKW